MGKILINGNFLCRSLTGIERFAWEICRELDTLLESSSGVSLYVPANAQDIPRYQNISILVSKKAIRSFPLWDMGTFARECRRQKATGLNFSNTAPLGKACGLAFIHDIYAKDCPQDFSSLREKLIMMYSRLSYWNIARNAQKILTVSEFSRRRIMEAYHVPFSRTEVIPNGWDHFACIKSDSSIFQKFPRLEKEAFYFTLGSLSKRKNIRWIAEYASARPQELFAISGKAISGGFVPQELRLLQELPNAVLLGYVTDGQVKALMEKCRAFVFPSYYEGFGIPPLEALSCKARIIVSHSASLPEIYGSAASYIDPASTDCRLEELLQDRSESASAVLETYTYRNAALKLKKIIENEKKQ